ncbi:MAG TPA: glycosyltransferase, partial [Bacteroidales bacterium]|nr:glycosyltransferase [Bacteroidales bacterium]
MRVLIIDYKLRDYRIPVFELLAKVSCIDLTIGYWFKSVVPKNVTFKTRFLYTRKIYKTFVHPNLLSICNEYDVVIAQTPLHWFSISKMAFSKERKFKFIYWTIGVRASYNSSFDKQNFILEKLSHFFYKKADAMLFYTSYPVKKFINSGFDKESLFVANNTIVPFQKNTESIYNRDILIFVGTLYKGKKVELLLEAYNEVYRMNSRIPNLHIVGDGSEFEAIRDWILNHNLENKIILEGAIFEEEKLSVLFRQSIACISPNQAGLTVQKSMAYGVPFITYKYAITGGERLAI